MTSISSLNSLTLMLVGIRDGIDALDATKFGEIPKALDTLQGQVYAAFKLANDLRAEEAGYVDVPVRRVPR